MDKEQLLKNGQAALKKSNGNLEKMQDTIYNLCKRDPNIQQCLSTLTDISGTDGIVNTVFPNPVGEEKQLKNLLGMVICIGLELASNTLLERSTEELKETVSQSDKEKEGQVKRLRRMRQIEEALTELRQSMVGLSESMLPHLIKVGDEYQRIVEEAIPYDIKYSSSFNLAVTIGLMTIQKWFVEEAPDEDFKDFNIQS